LSSRSVASFRADPAQHSVPRLNIASKIITFFIGTASFLPLWQEQYSHPEHKSAVEMPGTPSQCDLSKLGSKRSEQYCSRRTCPSEKRARTLDGWSGGHNCCRPAKPPKASLHGRRQHGHHRCRGRCNCVALHACDVPWFGPHVVLLGYRAYTTLYDSLMS
jgi:hypothetical protein